MVNEPAPFTRLLICWTAYFALCLLAVLGLSRITFNDGIAKSFQSDTPQYHQYEQFLARFDTGENEIFVLFEGNDFANPADLAMVADFLVEVQFEDGTGAVVSPFSLSDPNGDGGRVIPAQLPTQPVMAARFDAAQKRIPGLGRMMSPDRKTLLVALIPSDDTSTPQERRALYQEIEALAAKSVQGTQIAVTLTGYGVLLDSVAKKLTDDFLLLNIFGIAAGTLISVLALRSVTLALIVAASSITSLLWVLGAMGFAGIEINVVTVTMPALVLVLSYANALHLGFELRHQRQTGAPTYLRTAIRRMGPASFLSALTTAIAFASLMFSSSSLVRQLGLAGSFSTILLTAGIYTVLPLFMATAERMSNNRTASAFGKHSFPNWLTLGPVIAFSVRNHRAVTTLTILGLIAGLGIYTTAQPRFTLFENSAPDDPSRMALQRIERDLVPVGAVAFTHPTLPADSLQAAQAALARLVGERNLLSGKTFQAVPDTAQGVQTNGNRANFFASESGDLALLLISHAYVGALETREFLDDLHTRITDEPLLSNLSPPTGMLAVSSLISRDMLNDFSFCFIIAVLCSSIVIALWLKSPVLAMLAMVPNVLPIAIVGAWLALSGNGLQFTSGVAMTIAFGLAIDDTVHVLNRMRLNGARGMRYTRQQIVDSVQQVAPALVISTLVLAVGISGTLSAALPSIVYFGQLSIAVYVLALIADIVVFPACLMSLSTLVGRSPESETP